MEDKIVAIEAGLFGLWRRHELRQSGGMTAVDHLEWQERETLAAHFLTKARQRGVSPRLFWQAVINAFRPTVPATEAQLYLEAKELDWLLNSPRETGDTGGLMAVAGQGPVARGYSACSSRIRRPRISKTPYIKRAQFGVRAVPVVWAKATASTGWASSMCARCGKRPPS